MSEDAPFLPVLSPVGSKPVHVDFDGGRLTSDGGVLLLAEIEKKLGEQQNALPAASRTRVRPSG